MRDDVHSIFDMGSHEKQVMMFNATLSKEILPFCKKFMNEVNKLMFNFILYITLNKNTLGVKKVRRQEEAAL